MKAKFNKLENKLQTFDSLKEETVFLRELYKNLNERKSRYITIKQKGNLGDIDRIRGYSMAYRQVLLHRTIALFCGAINSCVEDNVYVMSLSIRGFYETTASLGYLHNRLLSLKNGNLDASKMDEDIMAQFLGTKQNPIPEAMSPKQVLTMIEYADKSISKNILGGNMNDYKILMDGYVFLCEFAHPNFHSNSVGFDLEKERSRVVLRHNKLMRENELSLVLYLSLISALHINIHDDLDSLLLK